MRTQEEPGGTQEKPGGAYMGERTLACPVSPGSPVLLRAQLRGASL